MRIEGRRYRDEWLSNSYPARLVGDKYVTVSRTGRAQILARDEREEINEFFMKSDLFSRLERTGHILTASNSQQVMSDLAEWLSGTYDGPGLHIIVVTNRCNLNCTYCHMNPQPVESARQVTDLQLDLIPDIVRFILSSPNPQLTIEFQGGEPFLNFPAIVATVKELKKQNVIAEKTYRLTLVSNLMVASDNDLAFCLDNDIKVSYTLNGPATMHDHFRITRNGQGSHHHVINKIEHIKEKFPGLLAGCPLCVIAADNIDSFQDAITYFHDLGFNDVSTLYLKNLGNAARGGMQFDMKAFIPKYLDVLDFICSKNRSGEASYSERFARIALMKIFGRTNPGFIDWRNPIGYVSNSIIYDVDGELLPVDEARSLRDIYKLGNVRTLSYADLISKREVFDTVNLSIRDRDSECRECAYNPYCGVSPVLHYAKTGRPAPEPYVSDECLFVIAIFDWLFLKLQNDPIPVLKMLPGFWLHYQQRHNLPVN